MLVLERGEHTHGEIVNCGRLRTSVKERSVLLLMKGNEPSVCVCALLKLVTQKMAYKRYQVAAGRSF